MLLLPLTLKKKTQTNPFLTLLCSTQERKQIVTTNTIYIFLKSSQLHLTRNHPVLQPRRCKAGRASGSGALSLGLQRWTRTGAGGGRRGPALGAGVGGGRHHTAVPEGAALREFLSNKHHTCIHSMSMLFMQRCLRNSGNSTTTRGPGQFLFGLRIPCP